MREEWYIHAAAAVTPYGETTRKFVRNVWNGKSSVRADIDMATDGVFIGGLIDPWVAFDPARPRVRSEEFLRRMLEELRSKGIGALPRVFVFLGSAAPDSYEMSTLVREVFELGSDRSYAAVVEQTALADLPALMRSMSPHTTVGLISTSTIPRDGRSTIPRLSPMYSKDIRPVIRCDSFLSVAFDVRCHGSYIGEGGSALVLGREPTSYSEMLARPIVVSLTMESFDGASYDPDLPTGCILSSASGNEVHDTQEVRLLQNLLAHRRAKVSLSSLRAACGLGIDPGLNYLLDIIVGVDSLYYGYCPPITGWTRTHTLAAVEWGSLSPETSPRPFSEQIVLIAETEVFPSILTLLHHKGKRVGE